MKNNKKGFAPIILILIAMIVLGGGYYLYSQKTNQPAVQTQASISDVIVEDEGLFFGNLSISWKSSNVEKVDIYLYNVGTNELGRAIATSTDNKGTYYYEIEDAAAWRDYDGPYKVIVSSSMDSSIKAESKSLKIGRPCSPDVCGDAGSSSESPVINSISPTKAKIGTKIEIKGNNFSGFENDIIFWIKNIKGEKGVLFTGNDAVGGGTDTLVQTTITDKICTKVTIYSGETCTTWLSLILGEYKIYTETPEGKSNEVAITITK